MFTWRNLLKSGLTVVIAAAAVSLFLADCSGTQLKSPEAEKRLLPGSDPPAKKMLAVHMIHMKDLTRQERTTYAVMQGLINRVRPEVYLVYDREDEHWLNWLKERGDIETIEWVKPYEIFRRFRNRMKGCIVTDPDLPGTINVATFIGAVNDWLVVSPELIDVFKLPVKEDLRGRWKHSIDGYRWAYNQSFSSASKKLLCHLNPYAYRFRDYMTANKVFIFWLSGVSGEQEKEEELAFELFKQVGTNTPVLGWWGAHRRGPKGKGGIGEGGGRDIASEQGLFTFCTAWDGHCEGTSNTSVHSGTHATFKQKPSPPLPKLEDKVYYTFVRTDGDGANFWRQEFLRRWNDPEHGKVPVSWPIGPLTSELMPDIMDYFYKNATDNDTFMVAVSGIGYINEDIFARKLPPEEREKVFDKFLRRWICIISIPTGQLMMGMLKSTHRSMEWKLFSEITV